MFPVIYLLEDWGEATGTTYRFCSVACRTRFRQACPDEVGEPAADGEEDYCNDGEICCQCGTPLERRTR